MIIEWAYGTYYQQLRYAGLGLINNYSSLLTFAWSYDPATSMVTITTYSAGTYVFGPITGGGGSGSLSINPSIQKELILQRR